MRLVRVGTQGCHLPLPSVVIALVAHSFGVLLLIIVGADVVVGFWFGLCRSHHMDFGHGLVHLHLELILLFHHFHDVD